MENIQDDKNAAPLEDNAAAPVEDTSTANVTEQTNESTNNPAPVAPAFDPLTSYESLKSELEKQNKAYSEIRKEFTRRTQHESELQKKLDLMYETLSKATEVPVDPEVFIRELKTHGAKALEPHFQKWAEPIKKDYEGKISAAEAKNLALDTEVNLMRRRSDSTNYPDFAALEPIMRQLSEDENCPVNWNMPLADCIDTLYKLAKDRSAESAVAEAMKLGERSAEKKLVREARTAVTGGGKSVSTSHQDLSKIDDLDKLRKAVSEQIGIAERD